MRTLIVHAHPEPGSFNAAMRDAAAATLIEAGHEVTVSDLYASDFDPVAAPRDFVERVDPLFLDYLAEQRHASRGAGFAPDIATEQARVAAAGLLILQFPIWWRSAPAILKGWFDRVLASGFAFAGGRTYDTGPLRGKAALIAATTAAPLSPSEEAAWLHHIADGVLAYTGLRVLPPFVAGGPQSLGPEARADLLQAYRNRIAALAAELAPARAEA